MSADPFLTPADWDEELAGDWAGRLDDRAAEDMQVRLRLRVCQLAGLQPGGHAVELGCGTGPLLAGLAEAVGPSGTVLGVEPQPVFAERARARLAAIRDAVMRPSYRTRAEAMSRLTSEDGAAPVIKMLARLSAEPSAGRTSS